MPNFHYQSYFYNEHKNMAKKFHAGPYQFLDLSIVKVFHDNLIKHGLIEPIIFFKEEENTVGKVKKCLR